LFFLKVVEEEASFDVSKLFQMEFARIILDDAFAIMDPVSDISEQVCMLRGHRRWSITPTPVPSRYLFSYLRFLQAAPLNDVAVLVLYF
jgi:SNF2 family DNA or RNA helicase